MSQVPVYLTPSMSRAARGALDISQRELARRASVSESTVRDFEKGRRVPSHNNLLGIQAALEAAGISFVVDPHVGTAIGVELRLETAAHPKPSQTTAPVAPKSASTQSPPEREEAARDAFSEMQSLLENLQQSRRLLGGDE